MSIFTANDLDISEYFAERIFASVHENLDREYEVLSGMALAFRAIYTTDELEREVCNGGWVQFFYNSGGILNEFLLDDLSFLKAECYSDVVSKALAVYAEEAALFSSVADCDFVDAAQVLYPRSSLNDLHAEFFHLYDTDPLWGYRARLIRSNEVLFSMLLEDGA